MFSQRPLPKANPGKGSKSVGGPATQASGKSAKERLRHYRERVGGLGTQAGFTGGVMGGVDPTREAAVAGDLRTLLPAGQTTS